MPNQIYTLLAFATCLSLTSHTRAALIDFNEKQGADGDYTINTPTTTATALGTSGITATFSGQWSDSGSSTDHQGAYTIDAAEDYFFVTSDEETSGTLVLSGLTEALYDINIFASIASEAVSSPRLEDITVNGAFSAATQSNDFNPKSDGFDDGTILMWSNVAPDEFGQITVVVSIPAPTAGGNHLGTLNALEFTAVPEPATLSVLMLGAFTGLCGRRKCDR